MVSAEIFTQHAKHQAKLLPSQDWHYMNSIIFPFKKCQQFRILKPQAMKTLKMTIAVKSLILNESDKLETNRSKGHDNIPLMGVPNCTRTTQTY